MGTLIRRLALVTVITLGAAGSAAAQAVFSGVVLGPDGAPVEGVTIYVTSVATSAQLDFPTPPNGRFEFSGLPAGQYRFTSDIGVMPFTFTLEAGERVDREIKIPFGPFNSSWTIVPPNPALQGRAFPSRPPNCAGFGPPLCGTESMVKEFERDEQERLKRPVLGPRMTTMPVTLDYPQQLIDARREGRVTFAGRIATDGSLVDLRVVSSDHPDLVEPARASVESARWEAARLRGTAVEVPMTVVVQFVLQPRAPIPGGIAQSIAFAPAQAPAPPAFEVASVKPNNSGAPMVSVRTLPGGGFQAINQTLRGLIREPKAQSPESRA